MATQEYNVDQAGLDAPRRTEPQAEAAIKSAPIDGAERGWKQGQDQEKSSFFPTSTDPVSDQAEGAGASYGGVSENEPPHHKIHSEDELLPKPKSGSYYDDVAEGESKPAATEGKQFGTVPGGASLPEPREEQALPTPTGSGHGGEPKSTVGYQDFRTSQSPVDDTPAIKSRSFGDDKKSEGGYADPSSAFPDAPVDTKVEERGYGTGTKASEPLETTPESPTPKKEGFVQKLMEKLPGHHKTGGSDAVEAETAAAHTGAPKKSLVTKIKEKLPGHHHTDQTATPTVE